MIQVIGRPVLKNNQNEMVLFQRYVNQKLGIQIKVRTSQPSRIKLTLEGDFRQPYDLSIRSEFGSIKKLHTISPEDNFNGKYTFRVLPTDQYVILTNQSSRSCLSSREYSLRLKKFTVEPFLEKSSPIHSPPLSAGGLSSLDKIYYINMDSRPERRAHILSEFDTQGISRKQVQRVRAVTLPHNPQVGCAMSHMKALSDACKNKYDTVLILEDDFTFRKDRRVIDNMINRLNSCLPDWDVAMLTTVNSKTSGCQVPGISRVTKADTTAGYLIRRQAMMPVFNIFLNCTKPPSQGNLTNNYAIDVAWQMIQPKMNWYLFTPALGSQSEQFPSDIERFRQVQWML